MHTSCIVLTHFVVDLTEEIVDVGEDDACTAGYCLSLPGRTLYLTPLLAMKKFRRRGNKDGAIRAFYRLEEDGLGKVLEISGSKGILTVRYLKCESHFIAYTCIIMQMEGFNIPIGIGGDPIA